MNKKRLTGTNIEPGAEKIGITAFNSVCTYIVISRKTKLNRLKLTQRNGGKIRVIILDTQFIGSDIKEFGSNTENKLVI